jgi:hypothetical protein
VAVGYTKNKATQTTSLGNYGYVRDNALSKASDNVQVYYSPQKGTVLVNTLGTNTAKDWGTNAKLALGFGYKESSRYNETKSALTKAKAKYGDKKQYILTGHSQSGQAVNNATGRLDKGYTLDPAYTIGQKARGNIQNYRTSGDIVSVLAPSKNTTTLANRNRTTLNPIKNLLRAHDVKNIKDAPIYVD